MRINYSYCNYTEKHIERKNNYILFSHFYNIINIKIVKLIYIIVIFLGFQHKAYSQEISYKDNSNIEFKTYYGFIFKHRASLGYYIKDHIPAFEINMNLLTDESKIYHQTYRKPTIGIGYYFANLGNPAILGNAHALFGFINTPFAKSEKVSFNFRFASGFSYLTKCFNITENYYNTAIGSKPNVYVNIGLNLRVKLYDRLVFTNGISMIHFSNGAFKMPNLGINLINYDIGLQYKINRNPYKNNKVEIPPFEKRNEFSIIFTNGVKEIAPPDDRKYYVYNVCFNAERVINNKRTLGMGLDIFNDNSIYQQFKNENISPNFKDVVRLGFHISTDIIFGKLSLTIQQGIYIYQKYYNDGDFYSRYGFKYLVSKHIFVNYTIKTHIVKADFLEFGIGYKIY